MEGLGLCLCLQFRKKRHIDVVAAGFAEIDIDRNASALNIAGWVEPEIRASEDKQPVGLDIVPLSNYPKRMSSVYFKGLVKFNLLKLSLDEMAVLPKKRFFPLAPPSGRNDSSADCREDEAKDEKNGCSVQIGNSRSKQHADSDDEKQPLDDGDDFVIHFRCSERPNV